MGYNVEDKKIELKTKKQKELQASPYQLTKENAMLPKAKPQAFNEESYQNTSYHKKFLKTGTGETLFLVALLRQITVPFKDILHTIYWLVPEKERIYIFLQRSESD